MVYLICRPLTSPSRRLHGGRKPTGTRTLPENERLAREIYQEIRQKFADMGPRDPENGDYEFDSDEGDNIGDAEYDGDYQVDEPGQGVDNDGFVSDEDEMAGIFQNGPPASGVLERLAPSLDVAEDVQRGGSGSKPPVSQNARRTPNNSGASSATTLRGSSCSSAGTSDAAKHRHSSRRDLTRIAVACEQLQGPNAALFVMFVC